MSDYDEVVAKYGEYPAFWHNTGADPDYIGLSGDAMLHCAARSNEIEDIKVLLAAGASVNLKGDLGRTPLHVAAAGGSRDAARILMRAGADRGILDDFNYTPADLAKNNGEVEIYVMLAQ